MAKKRSKKRAVAKKGKLPPKAILGHLWRAQNIAVGILKNRKSKKAAKAKALKTLPKVREKINKVRVTLLKQKPIVWKGVGATKARTKAKAKSKAARRSRRRR